MGSEDNDTVRDSDDFARGPFRPHGQLRVHFHDRLLHFQATGPFNAEAMQALLRLMALAARELPRDNRYADLVEIQGNALMTPEAFELLEGFVLDAKRQGFRSRAVLLLMAPEVEGRAVMLPRFRRLWADVPLWRECETRAQADAALAELRQREGW